MGLFYIDPEAESIKVDQNQNYVKLESVRTLLIITHLDHWKSYLVIICPNVQEQLTKSKLRQS